jgi:hypothetical protein
MRKIAMLAVLVLVLVVPMVVDACWWPGCEQYQNQNIYGYQEQMQGISGWYGVGMVQTSSSNLGSNQYQVQSGYCYGSSQSQNISGYQGQGQEQMTGFGYQMQFSEQSSSSWQSQYRY